MPTCHCAGHPGVAVIRHQVKLNINVIMLETGSFFSSSVYNTGNQSCSTLMHTFHLVQGIPQS
jgi:hypothetical protein